MSNFPTIIINGGGLPGPQGPQGQSGSGTGDVISINGLTGIVTGVAFTGTANNYTALQTFSAGITAPNVAFENKNNTFSSLQSFSSGISASGGTFNSRVTFLQGLSASGGTFGTDIKVNGIDIGVGKSNNNTNTRMGLNALVLSASSIATRNVAIGSLALNSGETASDSTAIGYESLRLNRTGSDNTAVGSRSLRSNTGGAFNTAIGSLSLYTINRGADNTAVGYGSLYPISEGNRNTAIGSYSGYHDSGNNELTSVTGGIYIGYFAKALEDAVTNEIVIGTEAVGNGSHTATIGATTQTSATIYGLLNTPGGISSAGGTFNSNISVKSFIFGEITSNLPSLLIGKNCFPLGLTLSDSILIGENIFTDTTRSHSANILVGKNLINGTTDPATSQNINTNLIFGESVLFANNPGSTYDAGGNLIFGSLNLNSDNLKEANGNFIFGANSLISGICTSNNIGIGGSMLENLEYGERNIAIGSQAGSLRGSGTSPLTSADSGLFIGRKARASANGQINEIVIGNDALGVGSNTVSIGNTSTTRHHLNGTTGSLLNIVGDRVIIQNPRTISSRTETGTAGTICWDQNYLYICVSNNAWAKVGLTW